MKSKRMLAMSTPRPPNAYNFHLLGHGVLRGIGPAPPGPPLPIPRGVYAIADALHLFWILGAGVLILGLLELTSSILSTSGFEPPNSWHRS